jgi:hypothetical protein
MDRRAKERELVGLPYFKYPNKHLDFEGCLGQAAEFSRVSMFDR